jgi:hypothetical protein
MLLPVALRSPSPGAVTYNSPNFRRPTERVKRRQAIILRRIGEVRREPWT